jgi:hypothetical protein
VSKAIINDGSRRVIIGPGPKSKGGGPAYKFDTKADSKVKKEARLGTRHEIPDEEATRLKSSRTIEAMGGELGLRVE